ncbi:MAG: hypothetical protein PHR87_09355 [Sulfurospirillaceae bacterium]|nr:hypothetical protein [Sulfurospirillaceae bacterium]
MKLHQILLSMATLAVLLTTPAKTQAADFDWAIDLNQRADANPTLYGSQLAVRFGTVDTKVHDIIRRLDKPADAYMILRLSEMTSRSPEYIIREYHSKKYQG